MEKRIGRKKSQLPDLYYEGYLEKSSFKDKTPRKLWTCLCGNTLFFFNEKRDCNYLEKLDLCGIISVTDDSSPNPKLDAARFNVQLTTGTIKFTAPNPESRELWKGFILSVAKLEVPHSINLLPGQIRILRETVQKENDRLTKPAPEPNPPTPDKIESPPIPDKTERPTCYYDVPRLEAELLLEREAKKGNMLLRPGRDGHSFALTTRQNLDGPVFRHYRLLTTPEGGFYIDVDKPVHLDTLHDVIAYMVEKTEGCLTPLDMEEQYDKNISFIAADNENGERTQHLLLDSVPANEDPVPVTGNVTPEEPEPVTEKKFPAEDKEEKKEVVTNEYSSSPAPPIPEQRKLPPTPAPRKFPPAQSTADPATKNVPEKSKILLNLEINKQILPAALTELKQRFGNKIKTKD